jgi:glucoamylase
VKRLVLVLVMVAGAAVALTVPATGAASIRRDTTASAPDAPGSESYFDLARKDCVGTARNTGSKVWFTVADGALSDVYWPTVDATNVHSLQYLVTDGSTFTDLQTRDMTYRLRPDPTGMSCTVIASDAAHGYRITTTYIADPARDAVLMRVRFDGPAGDQLYVRLDPLAGGTGGGGPQNAGGNSATLAPFQGGQVPVAFNANTTTDAVNRNYAVATYEALEASKGFTSESVGYAGSPSDGLTMLDATHQLTTYGNAPDGHVTLTAGLALRRGHSTLLALGFGTSEPQALSVASGAVNQRFGSAWRSYEAGWLRYDAGLNRPSWRLGARAVREYYESVNVVKASEDKTYPGAIAAGLASPWGQSVPAGNFTNGEPTYFGSYREVFARDLYEAFTGLLVAGDIQTARAATLFLFDDQQQSDGSMPRNSLENGKPAPDTGGLQLDETSYPILMDWQSGLENDKSLYLNHVVPAADFLVAHGPDDNGNGVERWEEQSGYSPSTIAAEIAGLTAAAHIASVNGDSVRARVYQATADDFARNIENWTVTTNGPYTTGGSQSLGVPSYFIRIAKNGDPDNADPYTLNNGLTTPVDQRSVIDAGFLELVRLGVLSADDPAITNSLTVVDDTIERQTPSGPGFYRYGTDSGVSMDGYGDCFVPTPGPAPTGCSPSGAPWPPTDVGTGHLWPVLSGERGEYEVAAGDWSSARKLLHSMQEMQSGQGLEPEQAWEDPDLAATSDPVDPADPATDSIGFVDGKAAGSASPLTWAQSQYARLALDLSAGRDLETPGIVTDRYVTHGPPGTLPVTITSPASGTDVTGSTVTISGTTTPGATVDAESDGAAGGTASTPSKPVVAGSNGDWSMTLATSFGTDTITVTATKGNSTGYTQTSVNYFVLPGTTVLQVKDPTGDDNGPGTYQYPTSTDFAAGSFDLTGLTVNQTSSDVYVQVSIANLQSTFGNAFGAQLLDVYVRNPVATSTSTQAAYTARNYTIAPADGWSELLEAQGFAPVVWKDPSGNSLGAGELIVDDGAPGTATLVLPTSAFGTVGSGWTFTVALTGQDGFNADQARGFLKNPDGFDFGVCAAGDTTDTICSVNPNNVANVIDTIPPAGVSQASEWNLTTGTAVLQGVTVP